MEVQEEIRSVIFGVWMMVDAPIIDSFGLSQMFCSRMYLTAKTHIVFYGRLPGLRLDIIQVTFTFECLVNEAEFWHLVL